MEIAYVNVFVTNLERAVGFYQQMLGLELEFADSEHGYASFTVGPVRLGLAVVGADQDELVGRHTGVGLATTSLVEDHARLAANGVIFATPPMRQPRGGFRATLSDPDGNELYLDEVAAGHG